MANIKISELVASDVLVGDEVLPIVQDGITKKVSVTQIVDKIDAYTKSESDVLFDTKVSFSDVKNDLISEDIDKPLSANQGKVLQDTKVDKVTGSSLVEDIKVTSYDDHLVNTSNPHGVTASQVGAYTTAQTDTLLNAKEDTANKGVSNGYASLDLNGKVPLTQISDSILGQLEYMGVWDFATLPTATQKGQYWVVSSSGNGYEVGDWAVYNGTSFDKVDNTDAVSSVAGRTGNVVLTKSDVGLSNVTNEAQEVLTNKKTDIEANKTSDTFFPSIKAVYDWAKGLFAPKDNPVFSGNVTHNNFTKFGSDAPAIKYKKLTGTTASTRGGNVEVAHGLDGAKIISATVIVRHSTTGHVGPNHTANAGYQFDYSFETANIVRINNHPTNSSNIRSKPFTVLITYEE